MTGFVELAAWCRRYRVKLILDVLDPVGRPAGVVELGPNAFLRARVLDRDGHVLAGRCQSEPGREHLDELADGIAQTLRNHGAII